MSETNQGDQPVKNEPAAPAATKKRVTPEIPAPKAASQDPVAAPVAARVRNRHDVHFRHDVFRSDAQNCLRDVGYEYLKPDLLKVPHAHVYHSHDNNGKKLTRTGSACGHWHDVLHYTDPTTGDITAKCGPAMHEVVSLSATGRTISRIEPVCFEKEVLTGDNAGQIMKVMDDHSHVLEYIGSEELSPLGIQNDLKSQQAAAQAMGITLGGIKDNSPAPLTPGDGVTMT